MLSRLLLDNMNMCVDLTSPSFTVFLCIICQKMPYGNPLHFSVSLDAELARVYMGHGAKLVFLRN